MNHIPPIHPGKILQDELEEIGISQSQLAAIFEFCRKQSMKFVMVNAESAPKWLGNFQKPLARVLFFG